MTTDVIEKALTGHTEALKAFKADITGQLEIQKSDLEKLTDKLMIMEEKGIKLNLTPRKKTGATEAIAKALDSDQFKTFSGGKSQTSGKIELEMSLKALTSLQNSTATPQAGYDVERDTMDIQLPVQQRLRILEVLPQRDTTANKVGFPLLDFSEDSDADYQEGEGEQKAEANLMAEWDEASIATIAVHTTASKQVLDDVQGLVEVIQLLMRYKLANKTDIELMSGDGAQFHIEGLLTQATAMSGATGMPVDRIGRAGALLSSQGYSPNVVIVNPLDFFTFASERSEGDGQYVAGGWSRPSNSPVYNLTPIQSMAVPVGQALVLDTAVTKVLMRELPNIQFGWVNDQFTRNLVTILAELRLGLLVIDPKGLLKVDMTEATTP